MSESKILQSLAERTKRLVAEHYGEVDRFGDNLIDLTVEPVVPIDDNTLAMMYLEDPDLGRPFDYPHEQYTAFLCIQQRVFEELSSIALTTFDEIAAERGDDAR